MSFRMKRNGSTRSSSRCSTSPRIASIFYEEIHLTPKTASPTYDNEIFEMEECLPFSSQNSQVSRPSAPTPTSSPKVFEFRESPVGSLKEEFHIEASNLAVERGSPGQRSQDSGFSDSKLSPPQSPNTPVEKCRGSEFCSCLDISVQNCLTPAKPRNDYQSTPKSAQIFTPSRLKGEIKIEEHFYEKIRSCSPVKSEGHSPAGSASISPHVTRVVISDTNEYPIVDTRDASVEANIKTTKTKRNSGTQTDFLPYSVKPDGGSVVDDLISKKNTNSVNYTSTQSEKKSEKILFESPQPVILQIQKESFMQKISPSIKKVGETFLRTFRDKVQQKSPKYDDNFIVTSLITPDIAPFFETISCATPEDNSRSSSPTFSNYKSGPRSSTPRKKPPCLRKKSLERTLGKLNDNKKSRVRWSDMPDFSPPRQKSIPDIPKSDDLHCTCPSKLNRSQSLDALPGNDTVYFGVSSVVTKGTVNLQELIERNERMEEQETMDSLEDLSVNKNCLRDHEEIARSFAQKLIDAKMKDMEPMAQFRLNPLDHWLGVLTFTVDQECTVALQSKDIPLPEVTAKPSHRKSRPVDYLFL